MKRLLIAIVSVLSLSLLSAVALTGSSSVSAQYNADDSLCSGSNLSVKPASDSYDPCKDKDGNGVNDADDGKVADPQNSLDNIVKQVINILSVIVGIVAVVAIIIGGFNFITSGGDSGKISSARNSVIYAIVGLIVVALAQVIVRFVLNKV